MPDSKVVKGPGPKPVSSPLRNTPDYIGDRYWAGVLAKRIQNYWNQKGYRDVRVWVESEITMSGSKFHNVRSNIVFAPNRFAS